MLRIFEFIWKLIEAFLKRKSSAPIIPKKTKKLTNIVKIAVKVFSQRDNKIQPLSTCFATSVAMTVRTLEYDRLNPRPEFLSQKLDDTIIADVENNLPKYKKELVEIMGAWAHSHHPKKFYDFWQWYIENKIGLFNVEQFSAKNVEKIKSYIDRGWLVICGTSLTSAGHVIVINGYDKKRKGFICCDPFGEAPYKVSGQLKKGKDVFYSGHEWLGVHAMAVKIDRRSIEYVFLTNLENSGLGSLYQNYPYATTYTTTILED